MYMLSKATRQGQGLTLKSAEVMSARSSVTLHQAFLEHSSQALKVQINTLTCKSVKTKWLLYRKVPSAMPSV